MSLAFGPTTLAEYLRLSAGVGASTSVSSLCEGDTGTAWREGGACGVAQEPAPKASSQGMSQGRERKICESVEFLPSLQVEVKVLGAS